MLQQIAPTLLVAAEEAGHAAAEAGVAPEWWGVGVFVLLLILMGVCLSFANRGFTPEAGQHEDPADLPADERALLDAYNAKRHA